MGWGMGNVERNFKRPSNLSLLVYFFNLIVRPRECVPHSTVFTLEKMAGASRVYIHHLDMKSPRILLIPLESACRTQCEGG